MEERFSIVHSNYVVFHNLTFIGDGLWIGCVTDFYIFISKRK